MVVVAHVVHTLREDHPVDVEAWIRRAKVTIQHRPGVKRFEAVQPADNPNELHVLLAFRDDAALGDWRRSEVHDALMHPLVTHSTQPWQAERLYRDGEDDRKALRELAKAFVAGVTQADLDAVKRAEAAFVGEE